jgi:alcohol dehydrogenase (cytochrome c)
MLKIHSITLALASFALASTLGAQIGDKQLRQPPTANWYEYNGSYDSRRHSELNQVNSSNVDTLVPSWMFHVPNAVHMQSVPIVANGVMYVSQENEIYALDARTGRQIWDYHRIPAIQRSPNRGVAIWGDKIYFTTPDDYLVALNAMTGNVIWESKFAEMSEGYCSPAAPLIVKGKVIVGVAFGDRGLNGVLDALDATTGEVLWSFHAIPKPGEPGHETWPGDSWKAAGGATWLTGSYDPELNLLYWPIGNPSPDFNGDVRKGDNLYTESIVALNPDSGEMKWYFQFTPHDTMDWDAVQIPMLIDAAYQGKPRKLLAHADRNGFYYLLDRETGQYLHGSQFARKLNWASGLTPEGKPIRVPEIEPSLKGTKICPNSYGATNWISPTYNPDTGYVYFVALEGCGVASKNVETFRPGGFQYRATGDIPAPDETSRMFVRALDMRTGEFKWEQERAAAHNFGGGLLSTAGGLIFSADYEGQFTAMDAKTGKILWHFNTGQRLNAGPITYSLNGKQYVALSAGADVISFSLFDKK